MADGKLLNSVPDKVLDDVINLTGDFAHLGGWEYTDRCDLKVVCDDDERGRVLEVTYTLTEAEEIHVTLPFAETCTPGRERLRFWLRGDHSGNVLNVACWDRTAGQWLCQATIPLDFSAWRHIEIGASNPIYHFHRDITAFRFSLQRGDGAVTSGSIRFSPMELVSPRLIPGNIPGSNPPRDPLFLSWGVAAPEEIAQAAKIGVNMHCVPIEFPTSLAKTRLATVKEVVVRCREQGMKVGLHFYNNPTAEFAQYHQELFPLNEEGVSYYDYYPGGSSLSLWHPYVRKLWRDHIATVLRWLAEEGVLEKIDVVMLSPGEEGEVSYQWDHIWAFDPYATAAYQDYLRRCYPQIHHLNADWGTGYNAFEEIAPPSRYYPHRACWVFQDFYRWSMLLWCVELAEVVQSFAPGREYLWLTHSYDTYPLRFNSARYPYFYIENLKKLGLIHYANIAASDWQSVEDMEHLTRLGVNLIAEIDVVPTPERLAWTFSQAKKYLCNGVYVGVLDNLSQDSTLTEVGRLCAELIRDFRDHLGAQ